MGMLRAAAVAGRFYPAEPDRLEAVVRSLLATDREPERALAVVVPHAGYVYSGAIAGETFARVHVPPVAVVLGPNHTGLGARAAVVCRGQFAIPGAALAIQEEYACALRDAAGLEEDALAHAREHSLEVQLPLLRGRNPDVSIVPICLSWHDAHACVRMGEALARALSAHRDRVLLVASTDMNHYLPDDVTRERDARALEPLLRLDAEGLHATVEREGISMCGVIPTTVVLAAARALGARRAELVRYGTSGDAFGERDRVVGYAGVVIQ
ncbi:MAG: AmmeMemoRadiSam system protein B [Myxococcota bacterium]|nr:AmmeMemoRadiSam system protein B [Myxococcota bacterium]MDW8363602.1 AmmeMemoRadiSam system protein B [Myxococcales bacterium]